MVTYRAVLDLPDELVSFVENVIATRRSEVRSPWRALTSFDQAVLTLVWLRDGDTFEQLSRHFGISTDTAWRYATKAMQALSDQAPTVADALEKSGPKRRMILDVTLIPTYRCAARPAGYERENRDPYYSGKHHRPGVNVQALMGMNGEPAYVGDARCGSTHDLTAAREDQIIQAAAAAGIEILADSGCQGASGTVRTPVKRPKGLGHSGHEKRANQAHAAERARRTWIRLAQELAGTTTGPHQPLPNYRPGPSRSRRHTKAIFTRPRVDRKCSLYACSRRLSRERTQPR